MYDYVFESPEPGQTGANPSRNPIINQFRVSLTNMGQPSQTQNPC